MVSLDTRRSVGSIPEVNVPEAPSGLDAPELNAPEELKALDAPELVELDAPPACGVVREGVDDILPLYDISGMATETLGDCTVGVVTRCVSLL